MNPVNPMSRVSSIPLKPFLDYSKTALPSEDAIFHLRTGDAREHLRHLQIVDVPHENVTLGQSWNFLDIPLSIDLDVNMSSVPLFLFFVLSTYIPSLACLMTFPNTITGGALTTSPGRPGSLPSTGLEIG